MDDEKAWEEIYQNERHRLYRMWQTAIPGRDMMNLHYENLFSHQEISTIETLTNEHFGISEILDAIPDFKARFIVWLKAAKERREKMAKENTERARLRIAELMATGPAWVADVVNSKKEKIS